MSTFNITHTLTNGRFACVVIAIATTTSTVTSVSDNGTSQWYFRNAVNNGTSARVEIWSTTSAGVAGGPTTITVNLSGASQVNAVSGLYSGGVQLGGTSTLTASATTILGYGAAGSDLALATSSAFMIVGGAALGTSTVTASNGNLRNSSIGTTMTAALLDQTSASAPGTAFPCNGTVTSETVACVSLELSPTATGTAGGRLVQGLSGLKTTGTSKGNLGCSFENPNTHGNLIVVGVSTAGASQTLTCSDSQGNTYSTALGPITGTAGTICYIFYAPNIKPGQNTVTVTQGVAVAGRMRLCINEYFGSAQTAVLDLTASSVNTGTALSAGPQTGTKYNEIYFGFGVVDANSTLTPGGGFALRNGVQSAANASFACIDKVSVPFSATASMTAGTSGTWEMLMAIFADAPIEPPMLDRHMRQQEAHQLVRM